MFINNLKIHIEAKYTKFTKTAHCCNRHVAQVSFQGYFQLDKASTSSGNSWHNLMVKKTPTNNPFPSDHHHPSVASSYSSLQTVYSNKNRSIWCRDKHKTLAVLFRDTGLLKQLMFSWSHSGFCYAPQWAQKGSLLWCPCLHHLWSLLPLEQERQASSLSNPSQKCS